MKLQILVSALIGIVLGFFSAQTFLLHSWTALFPWGIAGLIVGAYIRERKTAVWSGAAYGAGLTVAFLFGGFQGAADVIRGFVILVLVCGIIGALCGAVLGWIGALIRNKFT